MSRSHATREAWHPKSSEDKAAVLRELDAILSSPQFRNSKRYPALLEYIVRNTLGGRAEVLKERTLGVEVFDRPPTYDTNSDTIVRYTAGEVRKRLLLYYSDSGRDSNLRIALPAGSYVPEFTYEPDEPEKTGGLNGSQDDLLAEPSELSDSASQLPPSNAETAHLLASEPAGHHRAFVPKTVAGSRKQQRMLWLTVAAVLAVVAVAGLLWKSRAAQSQPALDAFWGPVLRDQRSIVICTGSVVFARGNYSGVTTAGRDLDYTFVSMQIASAIAQLSHVMEQSGTATQLTPSASASLTDLREHPVVLLGAYNNQWTLRLLDPLRFHFSPNPAEAIVDRQQPANSWQRDHSLPYESADDYALVARFRNPAIDDWVVALAGLGRNGTGAAAQYATSPRYMELLRNRVGRDFANKNIEVVLKVSVIDGKSGAPTVLAVYTW